MAKKKEIKVSEETKQEQEMMTKVLKKPTKKAAPKKEFKTIRIDY